MAVVREDSEGLYILANGAKHRPHDNINGLSHAKNTGNPGLSKGDKVKTKWGMYFRGGAVHLIDHDYFWVSEYELQLQEEQRNVSPEVREQSRQAILGLLRPVSVNRV